MRVLAWGDSTLADLQGRLGSHASLGWRPLWLLNGGGRRHLRLWWCARLGGFNPLCDKGIEDGRRELAEALAVLFQVLDTHGRPVVPFPARDVLLPVTLSGVRTGVLREPAVDRAVGVVAPVLRFVGVRAHVTLAVRWSFEACETVRADVWASHVEALVVRENIRITVREVKGDGGSTHRQVLFMLPDHALDWLYRSECISVSVIAD